MYYKVVTSDLTSAIVHKNPSLSVQYVIGEYVSAPCWLSLCGYGLMVFDSLNHAKRFTRSRCCKYSYQNDDLKIFECDIVQHEKVAEFFLTKEYIRIPFKTFYGIWNVAFGMLPLGSVIAQSVKLTKEEGS